MSSLEKNGSTACALRYARTLFAVPVTDETRSEQIPVGTSDGGEVFRCLRASYYKVGLYNIIVKGYPVVLVPVKKD